jgi:WbqC-like protein family
MLNNKNLVLLSSTTYLAPVFFYSKLKCAQELEIEIYEHYQKQTYRNRCTILSANGPMHLTIPVEKNHASKVQVKDVRISSHSHWQLQHWRAIESAYSSSPFFEYYADDFRPFFEKSWDFLLDFNTELQKLILELLEIELNIRFTSFYRLNFAENVLDLRKELDQDKLLVNNTFEPYYQVFSSKFNFTPNLSVVDLLFNMGNESQLIINN